MARNLVLSGLNTLLVALISTNEIPGDSDVVVPLQTTSPGEILAYIWKKLDELIHILPNFFAYLSEKLHDMKISSGEILAYIWKKLDDLVHILPNFFAYLSEKFGEMKISSGEILANIQQKLNEMVHILPNFFAYLAVKFDGIFPPDMRQEVCQWIQTAWPFVLGGLILLVFLYYFSACFVGVVTQICRICVQCIVSCCRCVGEGVMFVCSNFFHCVMSCYHFVLSAMKSICYCCGRTGPEMMKAPGRVGVWIVRSVFEANPAEYFFRLHAGLPI